MEPTQLKSFIKKRASELGFSAVGVSRARSVPSETMTEWLARNYQGQMSYIERNLDKRLNPRKILPTVRSVLSVALNYFHPAEMPYSDRDMAVVSRYARGIDYHLVVAERLAGLLKDLTIIEPKTVGKVYVDSGPVMEKFWAVESGLGWLGKHTNVLSRNNGSWFFLGEILLNLELEPDTQGDDFCGSCTRCICACPTQAIVEPYVLDARKCLSYTTIELKEEVPQDIRRATGNLVFGCDICQEVCPWNRKAPESRVEDFSESGRDYNLRALARLSPERFSAAFRLSAVQRSKWRGLMRNVAVAMGNSCSPDMIPELTDLLHCGDAIVSQHAGWALEQIRRGRQTEEVGRKTIE